MLRTVLTLLLSSSIACVVDVGLEGRACDDAHPCVASFVCANEVCVDPATLGELGNACFSNGTCSDALRCAGGFCVDDDRDAGDDVDSGTVDSGTLDSGTLDSGTLDSGTLDSGTLDSGTVDSGTSDGGVSDSGTLDGGTVDSGTLDSGTLDSGISDGGMSDAGVVDGDAGEQRDSGPRVDAGVYGAFGVGGGAIEVGDDGVALIALATVGTYDSPVYDAEAVVTWTTLTWVPDQPYGKALPPGGGSESGYGSPTSPGADDLSLSLDDMVAGSFEDRSGNGRNATCTNCPNAFGGALFGVGLLFDGSNDALSVPGWPAATTMTAAAWGLRAAGDPNDESYPGLIGQWTEGISADDRFALGLSNGRMSCWIKTNPDDYEAAYSDDIPTGEWVHFAMTYDGSFLRCFVNGELADEVEHSGTINDGTLPVTLGLNGNDGQGGWNGAIDEAGVWRYSLSKAQVTALYLRGAGTAHIKVRSCDDPACVGETYVGPSGDSGSAFSEAKNLTLTPAVFSLDGVVPENRYFQYRIQLSRLADGPSPLIRSVAISGVR